MSNGDEKDARTGPPEYETPTITEVGDAEKLILGTGAWKHDADEETFLE
ncbi:MAG: hypothetical protein IT165_15455 [Bryobacterales bacterium]|nr:hypothetical protein [Bryobacterales bacterium]MCZ2157465.1 hypothetical protein [Bryobacterales bacterium]